MSLDRWSRRSKDRPRAFRFRERFRFILVPDYVAQTAGLGLRTTIARKLAEMSPYRELARRLNGSEAATRGAGFEAAYHLTAANREGNPQYFERQRDSLPISDLAIACS
jgi:hypothetical protein